MLQALQNYAIQSVLEHGRPEDQALIISKLRGQMLQMARHKFASNVCEKALVAADSQSRRILIEEIMTPKANGLSPIVTMMKDQFASTSFSWCSLECPSLMFKMF
jgi:pumilio RNA-binding family